MAALHNICSYCGGPIRISKLTCEDCATALEGESLTPRLYRLGAEQQRLVKLCVLASGSLKEKQTEHEEREHGIFNAIEAGHTPPKKGMRIIENLQA